MKILIIFTGGTIGSSSGKGPGSYGGPVISLDESASSLLLKMYSEVSAACSKTASKEGAVSFDTVRPYTVLSEDLSAKEINLLIDTVREALDLDYDGIIVTHGSDTLQFSAAALALALGHDTVPVMMTASDRPLEDPGANGLANFTAAVRFIKERAGKGTFIPWRNVPDGPVYIHKALDALSYRETTGSVESAGGRPFAAFEDGSLTVYADAGECGRPSENCPGLQFPDSSGILVITPCPGAVYDTSVLYGHGCRLVLFRPYHSGTLPTGDRHFRGFCMAAAEAGIPLYISGCRDGAVYESALAYQELGIHVLPFSAFPADYMRLWAGLA